MQGLYGLIYWKNLSWVSLHELFALGLMVGRSPQLRELWVACFCASLRFIWQTRNKVRYDGITPDVAMACRSINGHVYAFSRIATGHMFNNIQELCVLKRFGATCRQHCAPKVYELNWQPPIIGWFKVNTDGAWKRGRIVQVMVEFFVISMGRLLVMAVIKAIELAWVWDWKHIWFEVDSSRILNLLHSPQMVPWQLQVAWKNCVHHISMMQFRCSHIFVKETRWLMHWPILALQIPTAEQHHKPRSVKLQRHYIAVYCPRRN
ncbi:hypothetical protein RchiOBHm_Chr1g0361641 [Rosa chinensis]|uniref:RNase H type-1 domain-containing protein n=1 Tax=Rosa chinensis TaxID=74649 RepID=A0A2P6SIZ5_ROSCH|nr:hypothetical protein RchiOBHm_Chr1g0361641 [Rosa chinensis]